MFKRTFLLVAFLFLAAGCGSTDAADTAVDVAEPVEIVEAESVDVAESVEVADAEVAEAEANEPGGDRGRPEGGPPENDGGNSLTDGPRSPGEHGPFSASDFDNSGSVTVEEIEQFMSDGPYRRLGLAGYFDVVDTDSDGSLSETEFALIDPPYAFDGTDADEDGVVTRVEVVDYVSQDGRLYREIGLEAFFALINTDGDDVVSAEEIEAAHTSGQLDRG